MKHFGFVVAHVIYWEMLTFDPYRYIEGDKKKVVKMDDDVYDSIQKRAETVLGIVYPNVNRGTLKALAVALMVVCRREIKIEHPEGLVFYRTNVNIRKDERVKFLIYVKYAMWRLFLEKYANFGI